MLSLFVLIHKSYIAASRWVLKPNEDLYSISFLLRTLHLFGNFCLMNCSKSTTIRFKYVCYLNLWYWRYNSTVIIVSGQICGVFTQAHINWYSSHVNPPSIVSASAWIIRDAFHNTCMKCNNNLSSCYLMINFNYSLPSNAQWLWQHDFNPSFSYGCKSE